VLLCPRFCPILHLTYSQSPILPIFCPYMRPPRMSNELSLVSFVPSRCPMIYRFINGQCVFKHIKRASDVAPAIAIIVGAVIPKLPEVPVATELVCILWPVAAFYFNAQYCLYGGICACIAVQVGVIISIHFLSKHVCDLCAPRIVLLRAYLSSYSVLNGPVAQCRY